MMEYELTAADRAPVPEKYATERRYLGYKEADLAKPYSKYFAGKTLPIQEQAREALIAGPMPSEWGPRLSDAISALSQPGYLPGENGYTVNDDGHIVVSILTHMPDVTGEMWDWWFGWHGVETARYNLWHPDAHFFSAMGEDRSDIPGLTDRQRYVENVSYVDEYIGAEASPLAIRFLDPERAGFAPSKAGETVIFARCGLSTTPVAFAWIIHQVRATNDGAEMRSRFFVNDITLLDLPAHSVASMTGRLLTNPLAQVAAGPVVEQSAKRKLREFGPNMLFHCASEMNHLASFLPRLFAECRADD